MPRVYTPELDERDDDDAFDDEDGNAYLAPASAFQYLPPPQFGGAKGPVFVAVRPEQTGRVKPKAGFFDRLFGGGYVPPRQADWESRAEPAAALMAQHMAALGAARAYIRYDGGSDEGFAWFDHCVMKDGSTRDAAQIAENLAAAGVVAALPAGNLRDEIDLGLASYWAVQLLGGHFGTGDYVMYGAFSVDLETGRVTDDPNPAPIVQNIELKPE